MQFLIGERGGARQAHQDAVFPGQAQVPGGGAHARHRLRRRLQGLEIEGRLEDEDAAVGQHFVFRDDGASHQRLPGQLTEFSGLLGFGDIGQGVQHRHQFKGGLGGVLEEFVDGQVKHAKQADEAGVPPQGAEEGLRFGQPVAELVKVIQLQIQQPVAAQEIVAGRVVDAAEQFRLPAKPLGQRPGGVIGKVRAVAIDDDNQVVGKLRKGLVQFRRMAAERQVRRQHVAGVGIDADIFRQIDRSGGAEKHGGGNHKPGQPAHPIGPAHKGLAVCLGSRRGHGLGPSFRRRL